MNSTEFCERLDAAYSTYIDTVCPLIMQVEDITQYFPVSVLNEVRAFTTHISKINLSDDVEVKEDNLLKAERHIKRMLLDCYKYMCIGYSDEYSRYQTLYKNVDWSVIDNGEFLEKVVADNILARQTVHQARLEELKIDSDEDYIYDKYEDAFNIYSELIAYIEIHNSLLAKAKHKYTVSTVLNYAFGIIGVVGTIYTFLQPLWQ